MQKRDIRLILCSRADARYKRIRERHYVANNGCIGRQIHYLIELNSVIVGIISGASCTYAVNARDKYFGINKHNRHAKLPAIINNNVFRLEYHASNLATQVLAIWRREVVKEWQLRYKTIPLGFETFVLEAGHRKGTLYKADNWYYAGKTAGVSKSKPHGIERETTRKNVTPKLIYTKLIS